MAKRDGWGETSQLQLNPPTPAGPSKAGVFFVRVAGIGAVLSVAGWLMVGDLLSFDGPVVGQAMIAAGLILGGVSGLLLPFLLSTSASGDSASARQLRVLSVVLVVIAISPALYLAVPIGMLINGSNN